MLRHAAIQEHEGLAARIRDCTHEIDEGLENLLDFARARVGDGLSLDREPVTIEPLCTELVESLAGPCSAGALFSSPIVRARIRIEPG